MLPTTKSDVLNKLEALLKEHHADAVSKAKALAVQVESLGDQVQKFRERIEFIAGAVQESSPVAALCRGFDAAAERARELHQLIGDLDEDAADSGGPLGAALDDLIKNTREHAEENHDCKHDECKNADEAASELEAVEESAAVPRALLGMLGVPERELEYLTGCGSDAGLGRGSCVEDVMRHVRAMPSFRAEVLRLAERILCEELPRAVAP